MKHRQFIFESYEFKQAEKTLWLRYSLDGSKLFTETYTFDFDYADYSPELLDRALQSLFFMAGVSYYKTAVPPEIVTNQGELDEPMAQFFSKTYERGLGEFWYVNKLNPRTTVPFRATTATLAPIDTSTNSMGMLVAIGGGKDSLVTIEALRPFTTDLATWSLNHSTQLQPLIERIGLPHYQVQRTIDPSLLTLNEQGALNGHVPISAIFACVGAVVAILSGRRDIVMSNEQSANEPTLTYEGVEINHQYSKSQAFEEGYQAYLQHTLGGTVRYYSFLRPLSELRIAELFAEHAFDKYKDVFSSCNRAFTHASDRMFWCGTCAKCAFVYMALAPFVAEDELNALWGGKNILKERGMQSTYRQLLGIEGSKPLDCVGEIQESRKAMQLSQRHYPELQKKYMFDIPETYDFRARYGHALPVDIEALFSRAVG